MTTNAQALGNVLPGMLFGLGKSLDYAKQIDLKAWLDLDIDQRAPVRCVVMFDVVEGQLQAVVFNTVADEVRWCILARLEEMGTIYLGMRGDRPVARGTLMVSAPQSNPPKPTPASPSDPKKPESPFSDVVPGSLPGGGGSPGPKGKILRLIAQLFARVAGTSFIKIGDVEAGVVSMAELTNKRTHL
jgi:hypothetical protein